MTMGKIQQPRVQTAWKKDLTYQNLLHFASQEFAVDSDDTSPTPDYDKGELEDETILVRGTDRREKTTMRTKHTQKGADRKSTDPKDPNYGVHDEHVFYLCRWGVRRSEV